MSVKFILRIYLLKLFTDEQTVKILYNFKILL